MTNQISNDDDVIDSRDVIARIDALRAERDASETTDAWVADAPDDAYELATLEALADEAEGYAADWAYGETLIRDSYFTTYAMELLEDCGYLPKDMPSWIEIDREATARNMRQDYTAVDFDGITYWVR